MIAPTTPIDSRRLYWKTPGADGTVCPFSSPARPAKKRRISTIVAASPRVWDGSALPVSSADRQARFSASSASRSAAFARSAPRSRAGRFDQSRHAECADVTTASTSSRPHCGTTAIASALAGFSISMVLLVRALRRLAIRYDLSGKAPRFVSRRGGALRGQSACRSSLGSGLWVIQHHALPDFVGAGPRTLRDQFSAFAACSWSASVDLGFC